MMQDCIIMTQGTREHNTRRALGFFLDCVARILEDVRESRPRYDGVGIEA
jgi:hypothetical protein